jgi:hypothetical protein
VGLAIVVIGGLVEGAALGLLQAWALAGRLGARGRARWVAGTVLVAGLGWAVASIPSAVDQAGTTSPSPGLVMLGAAGLGATMGAILGVVQAWAWHGCVRHHRRWILASAVGWTVAMPVIFVGATQVEESWHTLPVMGIGTLTGLLAGAVLGVVTGVFIPTLDGPPLRHRLVLALVASRLVHPADRDGNGALIGLCVTGARTGRRFRFPVAAARPGPLRLVVLPGHPERKTWWRNLASRPELEVLVDGRWQQASAVVLRCGDPGWEATRAAYAHRFPGVRTSGEPLVRIDLAPPPPGPRSRAAGPAATTPAGRTDGVW